MTSLHLTAPDTPSLPLLLLEEWGLDLCVLDGRGRVVQATGAWSAAPAEREGRLPECVEGSDLVGVFDALGSTNPAAQEVARQIRDLLLPTAPDATVALMWSAGPDSGEISLRGRKITGKGESLVLLWVGRPRGEGDDAGRPQSGDSRFRSLIENASDIITILDAEGTILYESPSASRVLGYPAEKRVSRSVFEFIHAADLSTVLESFEACLSKTGSNVPVEYRCRHQDGSWRILEGTAKNLLQEPGVGGVVINSREITQRKRAEEEQARLTAVMDSTPDFVGTMDPHGRITYLNRAAARMLGLSDGAAASELTLTEIHPAWANDLLLSEALPTAVRDGVWTGESSLLGEGGREIPMLQAILAHRSTSGTLEFFSTIGRDITERKKLETDLRQAQRLEAIGSLAAGIAHEINTPIQYVGDNIRFLEESFTGLSLLIQHYQQLADEARSGDLALPLVQELETLADDLDLPYVLDEFPRAVAQSLEGVERVAEIVQAMKEFSHPGTAEKLPTDLNRAILSTVTVARNEWKYVAEVVTNLAPDLPPVPCLPGDFNQAILNIIVNAAHAVADANQATGREMGTITVSTRQAEDWAEIEIRDTGVGIPAKVQARIFDPFFTTKAVGRGTGQGLTLARTVVVEKHRGTLTFETEPGRGTSFLLRLPLCGGNLPLEEVA